MTKYSQIPEQAQSIEQEKSVIIYKPTRPFDQAVNSSLMVTLPKIKVLPVYETDIECCWVSNIEFHLVREATCISTEIEHFNFRYLDWYYQMNPRIKKYESGWSSRLGSTRFFIPQIWNYSSKERYTKYFLPDIDTQDPDIGSQYLRSDAGTKYLLPDAGTHKYHFNLDVALLLCVRQQGRVIDFDPQYFKPYDNISRPELWITYEIPKYTITKRAN